MDKASPTWHRKTWAQPILGTVVPLIIQPPCILWKGWYKVQLFVAEPMQLRITCRLQVCVLLIDVPFISAVHIIFGTDTGVVGGGAASCWGVLPPKMSHVRGCGGVQAYIPTQYSCRMHNRLDVLVAMCLLSRGEISRSNPIVKKNV